MPVEVLSSPVVADRAITGSGIPSGTIILSQTGTAAVMSKNASTTNATATATLGAITLIIGTDTASNNASGISVRLQGSLRGIDWSAYAGKAVVVVGNHA